MRSDGGEAFGENQLMAVSMRRRGGLLDKKPVGVADAVFPGPGPELRHRCVVHTQAALGVNGHSVGAAGFGVNLQAMLMRALAEVLVVVVDGQVSQRLAQVYVVVYDQDCLCFAHGYTKTSLAE